MVCRCVRDCCGCHSPCGSHDPGDLAVMPGGRFLGALCMAATGVVVCVAGSSSLNTAPVTGSLLFAAPVCRLAVYCAAGFYWCVLIRCSDGLRLAVCRAFRFRH